MRGNALPHFPDTGGRLGRSLRAQCLGLVREVWRTGLLAAEHQRRSTIGPDCRGEPNDEPIALGLSKHHRGALSRASGRPHTGGTLEVFSRKPAQQRLPKVARSVRAGTIAFGQRGRCLPHQLNALKARKLRRRHDGPSESVMRKTARDTQGATAAR